MALARPVIAPTASGAITTSATLLYSFDFSETGGAATVRVRLRDGGSGGTVLLDITIPASGAVGEAYEHPLTFGSTSGMYATVSGAGTLAGNIGVGAGV